MTIPIATVDQHIESGNKHVTRAKSSLAPVLTAIEAYNGHTGTADAAPDQRVPHDGVARERLVVRRRGLSEPGTTVAGVRRRFGTRRGGAQTVSARPLDVARARPHPRATPGHIGLGTFPAAARAERRLVWLLIPSLVLLGVGRAATAAAQPSRPGVTAAPPSPGPAAARPIRALYVTGGGFHDFVALEGIVPPGIAARTHIVWTVDRTADTSTTALIARHRDTAWADQFDVVVYNMSFSWVVDSAWVTRLAHAHRDKGVAAVVLHGAVHSYRRSPALAWKELMGAASMRHDAQRPYGVERVAPDHPIVRALPKGWTPGRDELYDIERVWPGMTPLAQGWSVETEKHHPVAWTNAYGRARVFVTPMGHNLATMADPAYLDLVTRGLLWTLGKLAADGTAAPGYGPRTAPP